MNDSLLRESRELAREIREGLPGVTPKPYKAQVLMVRAGRETICHFGTSNNFRPPRPDECVANAAHYARLSPDNIAKLLDALERQDRIIAARDRRIARLVEAIDYARSQGVRFPADDEPQLVASQAILTEGHPNAR